MTHGLTKGTEYYGLNEVFTNYFSSLFKKTNDKPSPPTTKNRKPVDYVFFAVPWGLPSAGQRASQDCKQLCGAGPWLPSAVSQFKAQLAGEI